MCSLHMKRTHFVSTVTTLKLHVQDDQPELEAASLRITPLEEQLHAAAKGLPSVHEQMQQLQKARNPRRRHSQQAAYMRLHAAAQAASQQAGSGTSLTAQQVGSGTSVIAQQADNGISVTAQQAQHTGHVAPAAPQQAQREEPEASGETALCTTSDAICPLSTHSEQGQCRMEWAADSAHDRAV